MITIKQKIYTKDIRSAVFLHLRPRPVFAVIGIIFIALFLFALAWSLLSPDRWDKNTFIMLGISLYFIVIFFGLIPLRATRNFKQNQFFKHTITCVFDDVGLHTESELGKSDIPWDHFRKFKSGRHFLLLYPSDAIYMIFPKNLFTVAEWGEFQNLVGKKLKR